jgi:hypothetical protein
VRLAAGVKTGTAITKAPANSVAFIAIIVHPLFPGTTTDVSVTGKLRSPQRAILMA